ncbi:MAG: zinc dependent phospholipase C family protein [Cyanobacteriota bacterium]
MISNSINIKQPETRKSISFGWSSNDPSTHGFMTDKAARIVIANQKDKLNILNEDNIKLLARYADKPDEDEHCFLQDTHYYHHKTKRTIFFRKQTAMKNFLDHAAKAVEAYKNNNKQLALQELGRACHYLEDISQPNHVTTWNPIQAKLRKKDHFNFEKYAANKQDFFKFEPLKNIQINYTNFTEFIKDLAETTSKKSAPYQKTLQENKPQNWYQVANTCINYGQNQVATFIAAFINEVSKSE